MDRTMLLRHLSIAERHVALGESHLARQEDLIARMDCKGRDTTDALALLATMRATQALHLADRNRLLAEVAR